MKNLNYYICPSCGNVVMSVAPVDICCCGTPVPPTIPQKATVKMSVTIVEDEHFITCDHPMTKDNFIAFTIFVTGEKVEIVKHFPEWNLEMRIPKNRHGKFMWYSKNEGLQYQLI